MPASPILVRIVGRHALINEALATLISKLPGVETLETKTVSGDSQSLPAGEPSGFVLWFFLARDEEETITWVKQHPQTRVLLFSADWTGLRVKTVLQNGAAGCIGTQTGLRELGEAIRQIDRGEVYLSTDLTQALILSSATENLETSSPDFESLSPREQELIPLICLGLSNKQIAQKLYLSVRTIENHLSNIYKKLNVNSRTEVAIISLQHGWVTLPK